MTIKQNGGIFGRNPTFNEVDATDITTESLSLLKNNPFVRLDDSDTDNNGEFRLDNTSVRIEADKDNAVAGSKIKFKIDNSEIGFFDENGHLDIDGNLVVASGQGIDFSATSGTGTSELFDDYEEGEHTAVITATTSGTITLDSTNNKLAYTKVGRVVHVQGTIVVDSVSSPVGVAKITLPFTASNSLGGLAERSPPSIWIQGSVSKNTTDFIGYVAEGSNQISVGTGDSTNFLSLGANELQAASSIYISVTYTAS